MRDRTLFLVLLGVSAPITSAGLVLVFHYGVVLGVLLGTATAVVGAALGTTTARNPRD